MQVTRIIAVVLFWAFPFLLFSQGFRNDWINFDQQYYRIKVPQEGFYRITFQELQQAGFPVNIVNPKNIKLFYRGEEQAIIVAGEADNVFDLGDYIEFYAPKNDGFLDSFMFQEDGGFQLQPHNNLYSDASYVHLTYSLDGTLGKRISTYQVPNGTFQQVTSHQAELIHSPKNGFAFGIFYVYQNGVGYGPQDSRWSDSEGWFAYSLGSNADRDIPLELAGLVPGTNGKLEITIGGQALTTHTVDIWVGPDAQNLRLVAEAQQINQYQGKTFTMDLLPEDFSSESILVRVSNRTETGSSLRIGFLKVDYQQSIFPDPSTENSGQWIRLTQNGKFQFSLENLTSPSRAFDYSDPQNAVEIPVEFLNGNANIQYSSTSAATKKIYLAHQVKSVAGISLSGMERIQPNSYDYIILTHPRMMQAAGGYPNVAEAYREYRSSPEGGSYRTLLLNINDVYDQFAYGEVTPYAIREMARYLIANGNPRFLFIAGKGLNVTANYENNPAAHTTYPSLIPPYGYPGSDWELTARLGDSKEFEPGIPTGRFPAVNATELANYLEKVKVHDADKNDDLWRKRLLHLGGGANPSQLDQFARFLNGYEEVVTGDYLGARVSTLSKETTDNVEFIDILGEVNEGVMMITFNGHSGPEFMDVDIGDPLEPSFKYENYGKYPLLLMSGCSGGKSFGPNVLPFCDRWVKAVNKGAIAFLGHSEMGFTNGNPSPLLDLIDPLYQYSIDFYEHIFTSKERIHLPLGEQVKSFLNYYQENRGINRFGRGQGNLIRVANMQQIVFLGDPAVKLFGQNQPDFTIEPNKVTLDAALDQRFSAQADSLLLTIPLVNYGTTTDSTSIRLRVERTFPDGSTALVGAMDLVPTVYADTVSMLVFNTIFKEKAAGNNTFTIFIDSEEKVEEFNEINNRIDVDFLIPRGAVELVLPTEFGTVPSRNVSLVGFNSDPQARDREYLFELDTSATFSSASKRDTVVVSRQTPIWQTWLADSPQADSVTYFVRIKLNNPANTDEDQWFESSFSYVKEAPAGWIQRTASQLNSGRLKGLFLQDGMNWGFFSRRFNIEAKTTGGLFPELAYNITFDGFNILPDQSCYSDRLAMIAFDQNTGNPYTEGFGWYTINPSSPFFGPRYCGTGQNFTYYIGDAFNTNTKRNAFNGFIEGGIRQDGDYVFLMSLGSFNFPNLLEEMPDLVSKLGLNLQQMQKLENGDPFIALGRKNAGENLAVEFYPDYNNPNIPSDNQVLEKSIEVILEFDEGNLISPLIGPAISWENVKFPSTGTDSNVDDYLLEVIPISILGERGDTLQVASTSTESIQNINAEEYPYLQLKWSVADSVNRTPINLNYWQVAYEPAPEGVLFFEEPTLSQAFPLEYEEGDSLRVYFRFENISTTDFKQPIKVEYQLSSTESNQSAVVQSELAPLAAGESISFSLVYPTRGWVGLNRLNAKVNDRKQAELLYPNNNLQLTYKVNKDIRNPLLSVLFDGRRIMDGEIVSPSPQITVSVDDENRFLFQGDTTKVDLLFSACENCEAVRIPFASERVSWRTTEDNNFLIYYQPERLEDGNYSLEVVARDVSDNLSGEPYRVSFEVINESTITHFYPYPNPFSDNVRFVFTLTGSEIPDEIKIQIMTVSGRVVREILQDEIGPIRIGNNVTEYAWDGKDEFGDQLANGVYLYRVLVRANGSAIQQRQTAGDKLFKNNIGKLYLLR